MKNLSNAEAKLKKELLTKKACIALGNFYCCFFFLRDCGWRVSNSIVHCVWSHKYWEMNCLKKFVRDCFIVFIFQYWFLFLCDFLIFFSDFYFSCDAWKYFVRNFFKHFTPCKDLEGGQPHSRGNFVKEGSLIELIWDTVVRRLNVCLFFVGEMGGGRGALNSNFKK